MIETLGRDCCGCGACANICPRSCIAMTEDAQGFLFPRVDRTRCVECGLCERACPILHPPEGQSTPHREAWGLTCRDQDLLIGSSSGGLFTLLAKAVLSQGGCVFGAAFSADYEKVEHVVVSREEDLHILRGSKYVQSDINTCYRQVGSELRAGRKVLFSGTPCQSAGLRGFLGKPDENLICVDVICHGVPSPGLWRQYLQQLEREMNGKADSVSFRHKKNGWRRFGLCARSGDRQHYRDLFHDPYLRMFLKNYCLRESCYGCKIKKIGAVSDLTIGDFWGVEDVAPELNNKLGVSLALPHTEKGRALLNLVLPAFDGGPVDYEAAVGKNSAFTHSVRRPAGRDTFFSELGHVSWKQFEKKYGRDRLMLRAKRILSASALGRLRRRLLRR